MRNYDYMHEGMTDGPGCVPGRLYTVLRTTKKIEGLVDGWMATKMIQKTNEGDARLFVREGGSVAYFTRNDILR